MINFYKKVENFLPDRTQLTWRIPEGGESVMDLRDRINNQFLPKLFDLAKNCKTEKCSALFVDHGLFLKELHRLFGDIATVRDNFDNYETVIKNTAVSKYHLTVDNGKISSVTCDYFASFSHL